MQILLFTIAAIVAILLAVCLLLARRWRTQQATRAFERFYRSIFDHNPDMVACFDEAGRLIAANPAVQKTLGYEPAELPAGRLLHTVAEEHIRGVRYCFEQAMRGQPQQMDFALLRKNGSRIMVSATFVPIALGSGTKGAYIIGKDMTERVEAEEKMAHLAYHDALTGLPNQRLFMDRVQLALSRAKRSGQHIAIMFLDLDGFKRINDSLGHTFGDRLLMTISERLVLSVREGDTVSRLGGDEFVVLLSEVTPEQAGEVAQRILHGIGGSFRIGEHELNVTVSIGISLFPDDGAEADMLIRQADEAMYRTKQAGKNGYRFYSDRHPEAKDVSAPDAS